MTLLVLLVLAFCFITGVVLSDELCDVTMDKREY